MHLSESNSDESKYNYEKRQEQIRFLKHSLIFSAHSTLFPKTTLKLKDKNTLNCNFASCFLKLVFHTEVTKYIKNLMFVDPCIIVQFTKKIQQHATVYRNFISYLYEAQHVWGDIPPIIRSLKLHQQPLVLHTCKVAGRCQRPATTRPTTFHVCKTRGCQCSFRLLMMGGVSPQTC